MAISLKSPAFGDGGPIPDKYTRLGENASPPLQWSEVPEGTRSLALVIEDPDAPSGVFRHWAIYDIPADKHELDDGEAGATNLPQARNDFGETRYDGPQPPAGHGRHRYQFKLMALDIPSLEVAPDADVESVAKAAAPHVIDQAELVGTYERASKEM
ncbi:MAG: YbhB/YbcL family Raf kinase inhibitor-like protein [Hyphomicrobiales bacterium]